MGDGYDKRESGMSDQARVDKEVAAAVASERDRCLNWFNEMVSRVKFTEAEAEHLSVLRDRLKTGTPYLRGKWVVGTAEDFAQYLGMTLEERELADDIYAREGRWVTIEELRDD